MSSAYRPIVLHSAMRPTFLPPECCPFRRKKQEPVRRNLLKSLKRNFHWKCLMITLIVSCCITYVVCCRVYYDAFHDTVVSSGPCTQGYNFIPVAFGLMLYVVYIIECWHCRTRQDLVCKADTGAVYDYVEKLRNAMPIVWWRALCYHYIRRTRQVTRYRNGDAITTTQVYYERVNSHCAGSVFLYNDCGVKDICKQLQSLERYPVTKIRFTKGFVFANVQAAQEFEEQRRRFFQENEMRDDYMEVREGLDLVDAPFRDQMITYADPARRPIYMNQWTFWAVSLLLLSWPLRLFIEYQTAYVHYQVTKLFGSNYLSPSSQNYTGPLTRTQTADSVELHDAANFFVVPSYSQALLMEPAPVALRGDVEHDRFGHLHIHNRRLTDTEASTQLPMFNNEHMVLPNYGALMYDGVAPQPLLCTPRSRSLSLIAPNGQRWGRGRSSHRSTSFGNLQSVLARSAILGPYRTLSATPVDDLDASVTPPDLPEEPPPTYEIALRMCAPLYERLLRRSASSIQRLSSRLSLSLSRSSSRNVSLAADAVNFKDADTLL